jgi:uncharacterized protein YeaO (DUF488 family)
VGLEFKKLAPKWHFFVKWKDSHDNDYYIQHYNEEVLSTLDATNVVESLIELAQSDKIALVCYEPPAEFCHRHLVADWITKETGIKVSEFMPNDKMNLFYNYGEE